MCVLRRKHMRPAGAVLRREHLRLARLVLRCDQPSLARAPSAGRPPPLVLASPPCLLARTPPVGRACPPARPASSSSASTGLGVLCLVSIFWSCSIFFSFSFSISVFCECYGCHNAFTIAAVAVAVVLRHKYLRPASIVLRREHLYLRASSSGANTSGRPDHGLVVRLLVIIFWACSPFLLTPTPCLFSVNVAATRARSWSWPWSWPWPKPWLMPRSILTRCPCPIPSLSFLPMQQQALQASFPPVVDCGLMARGQERLRH